VIHITRWALPIKALRFQHRSGHFAAGARRSRNYDGLLAPAGADIPASYAAMAGAAIWRTHRARDRDPALSADLVTPPTGRSAITAGSTTLSCRTQLVGSTSAYRSGANSAASDVFDACGATIAVAEKVAVWLRATDARHGLKASTDSLRVAHSLLRVHAISVVSYAPGEVTIELSFDERFSGPATQFPASIVGTAGDVAVVPLAFPCCPRVGHWRRSTSPSR
jgi:hypothetical protein